MSQKRITLAMVAKETGYTVATVSMALRNRPQVNAQTRELIQQAAAEMGYVPDPQLSRLMFKLRDSKSRQGTEALGYITSKNAQNRRGNPHVQAGYDVLKATAEAKGFVLEEFFLPDYETHPGRLERICRHRGIQGLVFSGIEPGDAFPEFKLDRFSLATSGRTVHLPIHRACQDQYADTQVLLQQLQGRGYRRLGMILPHSSDLRVNSLFSAAFRVFQSQQPEENRMEPEFCHEMSREALVDWVRRTQPDGIVFHAPNTKTMRGWLEEEGIHVPEDIALAALDLPPDEPGSTGMVQNSHAVAEATVDLVVNQIIRNQTGFPAAPRVVLIEGHFQAGEMAPIRTEAVAELSSVG